MYFNSNRSQPISLPINSLNSIPHSFFFMCRLCNYEGIGLHALRMHVKHHLSNNETCSSDDIVIKSTRENVLTVPKKTTQLLLKCTICLAMFDYKETLLKHIISVHTNNRLFECLQCQSRFNSSWNLIQHMKLMHTNIIYGDDDDEQNDQQIESSRCALIKNKALLNSMDRIQQSVRRSKNVYSIHRNFSCPFCSIKFSRINTLKQHMTNYCSSRPTTGHHICQNIKETKRTDTYCSTCQITFRHKTSYDAHKKHYCSDANKPLDKVSV